MRGEARAILTCFLQEFRRSEAFIDELTNHALEAFLDGFALCKEQVQRLYPNLDFEKVQLVVDDEGDTRTERTGARVEGTEVIDLDREGTPDPTAGPRANAQVANSGTAPPWGSTRMSRNLKSLSFLFRSGCFQIVCGT